MTRTSSRRAAWLAWGMWGLVMAGLLFAVLGGITMGGLGFLIAFAIIPTVGAPPAVVPLAMGTVNRVGWYVAGRTRLGA